MALGILARLVEQDTRHSKSGKQPNYGVEINLIVLYFFIEGYGWP